MSLEAPRFIDYKPLTLAGFEQPYTFQTAGEIPKLWERFGPHIGKIQGQVGFVAYGLNHKMTDGGFHYMAGVEVDDVSNLPEGFSTAQLPSQRYAIFSHHKHISQLCETIQGIWEEWLPSSGEQVADTPVMFERYGETFEPSEGQGDVEVWLAIKS